MRIEKEVIARAEGKRKNGLVIWVFSFTEESLVLGIFFGGNHLFHDRASYCESVKRLKGPAWISQDFRVLKREIL